MAFEGICIFWGSAVRSINTDSCHVILDKINDREVSRSPADELAKNIDILLDLRYLGRLGSVEQREWRGWCAIINVGSARLQETAHEEDFEERVGILVEFEDRSGVDKFGSVRVEVTGCGGLEMFVDLVTED